MPYTEETIMKFGIHKGKKLANVPASYLLWCGDQDWCDWQLEQYVSDNREDLEEEAANDKLNKR